MQRDEKIKKVESELIALIKEDVSKELKILEEVEPQPKKESKSSLPMIDKLKESFPKVKESWRPIIVISIFCYFAVIFLSFFCYLSGALFCLSKSVSGAAPIVIALVVAELILLIFYSFLTNSPKEELVFAATINLPLLIFTIYLIFANVGLFVIGLVILSAIVRYSRR